MSEGGFDKRGPRQREDWAANSTARSRTPGKVTRTSQLARPARPPAPVQQRSSRGDAARRSADVSDRIAQAFAANVSAGRGQENDELGLGATYEQRAGGASGHAILADHGPAPAPSTPGQQAVQAKTLGRTTTSEPLWQHAEADAAALLAAFQGVGTAEQTVYRILNQPPEVVQAIHGVYNARYNRHTGRGLVADLRDELLEPGGRADWQFVAGQLARAGIPVPDVEARYERPDPAAAGQRHARIAASPDVRVAVPGTRITYTLVRGAELHAPGSRYNYQWYVLNDLETARKLGYPARVEGSDGPQAEATARFVGNHKVICREIYDPADGPPRAPVFHEFPQTVVPEGKLAQDAFTQAPAAVDPARQLEVLETFLQVLRTAAQQPGSAPLDPGTAASYEQQIAALRKRLASTEGAERIPIQAVHVDREKARVSPLRAFVARGHGAEDEPAGRQTWRLVDITNPESRRLSGEYQGSGKTAREAIFAALAAWDEGNRYPTGRIQLQLGPEAAGAPIAHTFQTDGMSFWDSISEFFAEVGFWTGMGALALGVVTAVTPVPGSQAVSALIWTSIIASSAAAAVNVAQRHSEGVSHAREDAMDVLTIAGNILAGAWLRGARVLVNGKGGSKIGTGLLIGQLGTDSVQGVLLGIEYLEQYERVLAIDDPKQRTEALMELLRSAALAGGMLCIAIQGTRSELGKLGKPGAHMDPAGPARLGNQSETIDLDGPAQGKQGSGSTARTEQAPQTPTASHQRLRDLGIEDNRAKRLITALRIAGLEARLLPTLADDTLARLADPKVLGEIEQVAHLQGSGRITGLDDWIQFGAAKDGTDLGRVLGELREARRLVAENPGAVLNIGGDARAPVNPTTGGRLASFDLMVETPEGRVIRSVEVSTVDEPLRRAPQITEGVRHAADKVTDRQAAGHPIPGAHDATIRVELSTTQSLRRGELRWHEPNGDSVLITRDGRRIEEGNIFDDIAAHISKAKNHDHLDRVSLVDKSTGAILAEYARTGSTWMRTR